MIRWWATAALAAALSTPAHAQGGWTVTCTLNGRIVHLERLPPDASRVRQSEILARNPGAMCVHLSDDQGLPLDAQSGVAAPLAPGVDRSGPPAGRRPVDVENALRVLRGERLREVTSPPPVAAQPTTPPPTAQTRRESDPRQLRPSSSEWVRLALYRSTDRQDVLADWRRIITREPALAHLVPALSEVDGVVMLSAGPANPQEREGICILAAGLGLDCVPGTGEARSEPTNDAVHLLGMIAPEVIATDDAPMSSRRPMALLEDLPRFHGREPGLACWRNPAQAGLDHGMEAVIESLSRRARVARR